MIEGRRQMQISPEMVAHDIDCYTFLTFFKNNNIYKSMLRPSDCILPRKDILLVKLDAKKRIMQKAGTMEGDAFHDSVGHCIEFSIKQHFMTSSLKIQQYWVTVLDFRMDCATSWQRLLSIVVSGVGAGFSKPTEQMYICSYDFQ